MSDLSAWIHLIIHFELPKEAKEFALEQVKRIEARFEQPQIARAPAVQAQAWVPPELKGQSPSTIANLMKDQMPVPQVEALTVAGPVSPMAAQALTARQALIAEAVSAGAFTGKPSAGRTSPRKF